MINNWVPLGTFFNFSVSYFINLEKIKARLWVRHRTKIVLALEEWTGQEEIALHP